MIRFIECFRAEELGFAHEFRMEQTDYSNFEMRLHAALAAQGYFLHEGQAGQGLYLKALPSGGFFNFRPPSYIRFRIQVQFHGLSEDETQALVYVAWEELPTHMGFTQAIFHRNDNRSNWYLLEQRRSEILTLRYALQNL